MTEVKLEHRELALAAWHRSNDPAGADFGPELFAQALADIEDETEARVRRELAELPDPLDVLGYGNGLEVCEQQEGWAVMTGINGEEFRPVALFFDKKRAEQYCELEVGDGCGGFENVAFDACASEAVIVRDRIIVANDYTIDDCKALRERVAIALTPLTSLPETAGEKEDSNG
jgi:hypothetical protein